MSPNALAPYSGMVPGWLAGRYSFDEICIDFAALAAAAGARLVLDELVALDPSRRKATLRSGTVLGYDVLSLNVGSTLAPPTSAAVVGVLSLRPLGELRQAWDTLLGDPALRVGDEPLLVTAVGGGAAGVESLLAALARLRALSPCRPVQGRLLSRSASLLPGMAPGAARAAQAALVAAGATLQLASTYDAGAPAGDLLLWATGAQAHAWQQDPRRNGGLAVSKLGFIRVDAHLRSISHPQVHAVGDCAEWAPPLPKAGVFAVRMGPVLAHNLRAAIGAGVARTYAPQRRFLALLATADGRAVASWGPFSVHARWVWRWKDHIDRGFLRRFSIPRPPRATRTS